jgi:uncharacterized protein (DUF4415 family)
MKNKSNPEMIDDENPEWTEAMFSEAKTATELFPHLIKSEMTQKINIAIDYDADIVSAFRATGSNWQTRMNDALREWLREHAL